MANPHLARLMLVKSLLDETGTGFDNDLKLLIESVSESVENYCYRKFESQTFTDEYYTGDGTHEHPTQGLLDMFTIKEKKRRFKGLKVAIVGDILHSRVARSNIWALLKLGAKITLVGPRTLVPERFGDLGVRICHNLNEGIKNADVINLLRIQLERQHKNLFPSIREYKLLYGVTEERLQVAKRDVLIMHPGPINRGVEISQEVADGKRSVINEQVTNGVAIRMAVLYLLSGASSS